MYVCIKFISLGHRSRNKRRKNDSDMGVTAIERIANALCENNDVSIDLPAPPVPDEVDSFLSMLGCQLRELPLRQRRDTMKQILDITYTTLSMQHE